MPLMMAMAEVAEEEITRTHLGFDGRMERRQKNTNPSSKRGDENDGGCGFGTTVAVVCGLERGLERWGSCSRGKEP